MNRDNKMKVFPVNLTKLKKEKVLMIYCQGHEPRNRLLPICNVFSSSRDGHSTNLERIPFKMRSNVLNSSIEESKNRSDLLAWFK